MLLASFLPKRVNESHRRPKSHLGSDFKIPNIWMDTGKGGIETLHEQMYLTATEIIFRQWNIDTQSFDSNFFLNSLMIRKFQRNGSLYTVGWNPMDDK